MTNVHASSDDIIIAVMGVTGAGKTTFIQEFASKKLEIGNTLESCASTMLASLQAWLLTTERYTRSRRTQVRLSRPCQKHMAY